MTPEDRFMLERALKLAEENNAILRKIRRASFWRNVISVVYWVLIIGLSIGAYYLIQPYTNFLMSVGGGDIQTFQKAADSLKEVLNNNK